MSQVRARRGSGFHLLNVAALGVLLLLMLGVYWAKTGAARDSSAIAAIEREIVSEKSKIRMAEAEVARLETPQRIETLSEELLDLGPVAPDRLTEAEELPALAGVEAEVAQ